VSALVVVTTAPVSHAHKIAKTLVDRRLAACVQMDDVTSYYRWGGKVKTEHEIRLTIKTRAELYDVLEKTLCDMTPNQTPEILAHPVTAGSRDYLKWIDVVTEESHD